MSPHLSEWFLHRVQNVVKKIAQSLVVIMVLGTQQCFVHGQVVSWMEDFSLSEDRESKLSELIPGSDDYYFYHCLHFQNTNQLDRSEAILTQWLSEHQGREIAAYSAMLDRQRLLTYQDNPRKTIDHLVRRLGIQLNHAAPPQKNVQRFPSQLDEAILQPQRLVFDSVRRREALKPKGLAFLASKFLENETAGIPLQLSDLLQRLNTPIVPELDELVIKELKARNPADQKFGDRAAHQLLTSQQLMRVAQQLPLISQQESFVSAVMRRMRPAADVDLSSNDQARLQYLTAIETYVRQLPAPFNHLKAAAAYRLLELQYGQGVYDLDLFVRYLNLPRISPIVPREWAARTDKADLSRDFESMALLPRIGNEEPLVRAYLEHFLRDAPNTNQFTGLILEEYLQRVFAETKLINGIGDEQLWYRVLNPAERQQVRDRKELRLTARNVKQLPVDTPAALEVDVKNINELTVRIYEINTQAFYRNHDVPLDTDIDLDGLVATDERAIKFSQPAIQRHRERIDLPAITGRGVWVVDLVGEGLRARALLRRGALDYVGSFSPDGMVFTIIDEKQQAVADAIMLVGQQEFLADSKGRIVIPPVVQKTQRRAIISDAKISRRIDFVQSAEQYTLEAGMYLDRSQMQSGKDTRLVVRPRLLLGDIAIDPEIVDELVLAVEAIDQRGLPVAFEVGGLKLDQNAELVVPLRVPQQLASIKVKLRGKVSLLTTGGQQDLETEHEWQIAEIRRTNQVHDAFLTKNNNDYWIEVRGRSGEGIVGAVVAVSLTSVFSNAVTNVTLQTNPEGRVSLGTLKDISSIRYSVLGGMQHIQPLSLNRVTWPSQINTTTDAAIRLAWPNQEIEGRKSFVLSELREGAIAIDQTKKIQFKDGFLTIAGLPAGDFTLHNANTGMACRISVIDGSTFDGVVAGKGRHLSVTNQLPISISEIQQLDDAIRIRLSGTTEGARVHFYGSRFIDTVSPQQGLQLAALNSWGRQIQWQSSAYVSDLRLGDEYQYVLRRRYLQKYPGVMLPKPGLLLNPWETEETTNQVQEAKDGEAPPPSSMKRSANQMADMMAEATDQELVGSSDYDFLADSGVILTNLRPDQDGWVQIPSDLLEGLPIRRIVVSNALNVVEMDLPASVSRIEKVDLRLAENLDQSKSYALKRSVVIAGPDKPLDLESLGSATVQTYGSVYDLFKLYRTLVSDSRLSEFSKLPLWGTMDQSEKLSLYNSLASHELHVFIKVHDPAFFTTVVKPHLINKREKQFLDRWLLEEDLSDYAKLDRYSRLNVAEKVLLARRLPALRETVIKELEQRQKDDIAEMDQLQRTIDIALAGKSMNVAGAMGGGMATFGRGIESSLAESLEAQNSSRGLERLRRRAEVEKEALAPMADAAVDRGRKALMGRQPAGGRGGEMFYQVLDSTKQWAESQWDQVRTVGGQDPHGFITHNAYWLDLIQDESQDHRQVSSHLMVPAENRHAAIIALALCGLPLQSTDAALPPDGQTPYQPPHSVAVVTKRLSELAEQQGDSTVLIGQRFTKLPLAGNTASSENINQTVGNFVVGTAYSGQIVVSNPTEKKQRIDLFWQIPAGSVPLSNTQRSSSQTMMLEPYAVQFVSYAFYFPQSGIYKQYPATASSDGVLIAKAESKDFSVLSEEPIDNGLDWDALAVSGNEEQLKTFFQTANLQTLDWMKIAHRMRDKSIYQLVTDQLRTAKIPIEKLWAYGFLHEDLPAIQTYLSLLGDFQKRLGPCLDSELLKIDPIEQRFFETLEYSPLIRARVHQLGERPQILNPTFLVQYESFIRTLGYKSSISDSERLLLSYYLLIQNRISESIEQFQLIDREKILEKMQYDYLGGYLALHQGNLEGAEKISTQYANYPISRWGLRFKELADHTKQVRSVAETIGDSEKDGEQSRPQGSDLEIDDRNRMMSDAANQSPVLSIRVDGNRVLVDHRNAQEATINFYGVDLELLFSKAPFVREDLQRMAMVRPKISQQVKFGSENGTQEFLIDKQLQSETLLIEVVSGAERVTSLYYGAGLTTYVSKAFGQLQVMQSGNQIPVAQAYVKVYAKYPDGTVRFYKDGYTDLRGRFDYASISAADARGAVSFAILVLSDQYGASMEEVLSATN